jgi:hypothetical protein
LPRPCSRAREAARSALPRSGPVLFLLCMGGHWKKWWPRPWPFKGLCVCVCVCSYWFRDFGGFFCIRSRQS